MENQSAFIEQIKKRAKFRNKIHARIFSLLAKFKSTTINKNLDKTVGDFVLITICNKASFKMFLYSLNSLYSNSTILPKKVVIVSDGSWDTSDGRRFFDKYIPNIEFASWENCALHFKKKGYTNLYEWAEKQIWGKKMVSILKYAEDDLTLFTDPDILWYNTLREFDIKGEQYLKVSKDNSHNYDKNVIETLKLDYLYKSDPINCGLVLAKGELLNKCSDIIKHAINFESINPGSFSEQTIIALMVNEFGSTWDTNEVSASISDIVSSPFKRSIYNVELFARHYVWFMSWMFWKDILLNPKIKG